MNYLFGDSSESNLSFNYLAFLREVIDVAVALIEHETMLGSTVERRRIRERDCKVTIQSVEELGRHAGQLFDPVIKEYGETSVGRCAAAIMQATRDVILKEAAQVRANLTVELEDSEKDDLKLRARTITVLEKMLKTHDLPEMTKTYEVTWSGTSVKSQMIQQTKFGVEATLECSLPANSVLGTTDLRVDKIVDNVEVNALELGGGGFFKKGDKLIPHKLGRYHLTKLSVGATTTLRLRATAEIGAAGFDVTARDGDVMVERVGDKDKSREYTVDEKSRPALRQLMERLETAARAMGDSRALVLIAIDGKSLVDHPHPQVLAERLINAIAPTVQEISRHSQSPGELVLRRMLGDDRREEIFVSTAELAKRIDGLTEQARKVFAPLGIERRAQVRPGSSHPPVKAEEVKRKPSPTSAPPARAAPPAPPAAAPAPAVARTLSDTIDLDSLKEEIEELEAHMDEASIVARPAVAQPIAAEPMSASTLAAVAAERSAAAKRAPALIVEESDEESSQRADDLPAEEMDDFLPPPEKPTELGARPKTPSQVEPEDSVIVAKEAT